MIYVVSSYFLYTVSYGDSPFQIAWCSLAMLGCSSAIDPFCVSTWLSNNAVLMGSIRWQIERLAVAYQNCKEQMSAATLWSKLAWYMMMYVHNAYVMVQSYYHEYSNYIYARNFPSLHFGFMFGLDIQRYYKNKTLDMSKRNHRHHRNHPKLDLRPIQPSQNGARTTNARKSSGTVPGRG